MTLDAFKNLLCRALRLPPTPEPPAGSAASIQVFRAAKRFYYYRLLHWAWGQASAVVGIIFGFFFLAADIPDALFAWMPFDPMRGLWFLEVFGVTIFLVQLPLTYLTVVLDYQFRWYFVTDRSLRIREGLFRVREQTMTFANIQNVSVHQGPLQRLFGIQDLEVRTAGGGEGPKDQGKEKAGNLHVGRFRGVANADEIRHRILAHLRRHRDAGLGDFDDARLDLNRKPDSASTEFLEAARELLLEVKTLRETLS